MKTFLKKRPVRYIVLIIGLFIMSLGQTLFIYSDVGMNPWNIFHQGLSNVLPITIGQASQSVGLIIITVCLFYKIVPGIATIINMILVGYFMDVIVASNLLYVPSTLVGKLLICFFGIALNAYGMYLYINQELGAGPRDGLMLALTQRTRFSIGFIKNAMEFIVMVAGVLLGGTIGIGTVLSVTLTGPCLQMYYKIFKVNPKELRQENLIDVYNKYKNKLQNKETEENEESNELIGN